MYFWRDHNSYCFYFFIASSFLLRAPKYFKTLFKRGDFQMFFVTEKKRKNIKKRSFLWSFMSREIRLRFVLQLWLYLHENLAWFNGEAIPTGANIKLVDCKIAIIARGASSVFLLQFIYISVGTEKYQRTKISLRWWSEIHIIKFYESQIKDVKRRLPCVFRIIFRRLDFNLIRCLLGTRTPSLCCCEKTTNGSKK